MKKDLPYSSFPRILSLKFAEIHVLLIYALYALDPCINGVRKEEGEQLCVQSSHDLLTGWSHAMPCLVVEKRGKGP